MGKKRLRSLLIDSILPIMLILILLFVFVFFLENMTEKNVNNLDDACQDIGYIKFDNGMCVGNQGFIYVEIDCKGLKYCRVVKVLP